MSLLLFLAPASLLLGGLGLAAFWWTVNNGQYDDPRGDAARILYDHEAEGPDQPPRAERPVRPAPPDGNT